eukprot:gene3276-8251_t
MWPPINVRSLGAICLILALLIVRCTKGEAESIYRINCGGPTFTDLISGLVWQSDDEIFIGSNTVTFTNTDQRIDTDRFWLKQMLTTDRVSLSPFDLSYRLQAPVPGIYKIVLHFVEKFHNDVNRRLFTVLLNDEAIQEDFDVFAHAGTSFRHVTLEKEFVSQVIFTNFTISFLQNRRQPMISGIEIFREELTSTTLPSTATVTSTASQFTTTFFDIEQRTLFRVNCGGPEFVDELGNEWESDTASSITFTGESLAFARDVKITGEKSDVIQTMFRSHRYSPSPFDLKYHIPIPGRGNYKITLFFAENFHNNAGRRVFDVLVDDEVEAAGFDPFVAGGGSFISSHLDVSVTSTRKRNATISFNRKAGHPKLSGIELTQIPTEGTSTSSSSSTSSSTSSSSSSSTSTSSSTSSSTSTSTSTSTSISTST